MEFLIEQQAFNGPLDLLVTLARKHDINILQLKILKIIDDFIQYIEQAKEQRLSLTTDFMVMTSYLLLLKSRLLLPKSEEEEEELEEEVANLLQMIKQYEIIKQAAVELKDYAKLQEKIHFRMEKNKEEYVEIRIDREEMEPYILTKKLLIILDRMEKEKNIVNIARERFNIVSKLNELFYYFKNHPYSEFSELIENKTKDESIVIFFAILILAKQGFIDFVQRKNFGPIHIKSFIKNDMAFNMESYE